MVYLLNHDTKTAIRFEPADGDLWRFLERYFNPFLRLLDHRRAEEWRLEVAKQDEWYTSLIVRPTRAEQSGGWPDALCGARVVLMNKDTEAVPKNMPRRLWYTDGAQEYTFEINRWQMNADSAPNVEEFTRPEDRLGWNVSRWPFRGKK